MRGWGRLRAGQAVFLQALGLGIWWEWFQGYAFGTGGVLGGIVRVAAVWAVLWLWSLVVPAWGGRAFGWDVETVRRRDAWAGLPLAALPLLIPLAPLGAWAAKPFSLQLTAFVWLPWWSRGQVLKPGAYAALLAGGALLLAAVAAKVVVAWLELKRTPAARLTPKKLFVAGFLAYVLLLSWPASVTAPRGGETSQLLVMQALTYHTRLNIDPVITRGQFYEFHPIADISFAGSLDAQRRLYLPVIPGMPLLFITFYLFQGRWLVGVLLMLFAAGAAAQLYGLMREQGQTERSSFWVWTACLANAPLLIYGYQAYAVAAGAFFLLWGVRKALLAGSERGGLSVADTSAAALAAGLLWLGGIRFVPSSLVILAVLGWQLFRTRRLSQLTAAGAVLLVPLGAAAYFYITVYGFFLLHPAYTWNVPWQPGFWLNGLAMIADRQAGLVWTAPVWLLALAGLAGVRSRRPWLFWAALLPLAGAVVSGLVFPDPRADGSSFHRFLAPMMPLLGVGLADFLESAGSEGIGRRLFQWTLVWGAGIGLLLTWLPFLTQEAPRLRLAEAAPALGWLYAVLPDLGGRVNIWDILLALTLTGGAAALTVYAARLKAQAA